MALSRISARPRGSDCSVRASGLLSLLLEFHVGKKINEERRVAWFDRSMEILKVCDAVYIYTPDGLPPTDEGSKGLQIVDETARNLGG